MNREAFEHWAWDWFQRNNQSRPEIINAVPREDLFFRKPNGQYHFNDMEAAWQGYQAGAVMVRPSSFVDRAGIHASDMPGQVVQKLDAAFALAAAPLAPPVEGLANFHYRLDAASGYEQIGVYPNVTAEKFSNVIGVLEGTLPKPFEFPALDDELREILGTVCFQCIHIAQGLRADGHAIETRAEAEQAAVLYWMLGFYFKHGAASWRAAAAAELQRMAGKMKEQQHG